MAVAVTLVTLMLSYWVFLSLAVQHFVQHDKEDAS